MADRLIKRLSHGLYYNRNLIKRQETYRRFVYGFLNRGQPKMSKLDEQGADALKEPNNAPQISSRHETQSYADRLNDNKWKLEIAWLTKALEQATQLWNGFGNRSPPGGRSVSEIIASIQRSKTGIEGWGLSDLTVGLYLIYLRQSSLNPSEDFKGVQISSEIIVQDLMYHIELAKGCYKDNAFWIARNSMLRESNILKFVKDSSVMRPGYYIGIEPRRKLVILAIRGTHTVYDLITDIISSSDGEVTFEGYSTHFGTAEAARWFLNHEIGTIRKCLEKYQGFRLRLVGHSLGAATASLLAIMLRKRTSEELGFSPDIVSAVGYATPPCVSRELAESCANFVTTVVMQDDMVPRLSAASLARLRNEILETDWTSLIEKEEWKSVVGLVTNAKQVVSSVQDVARKFADYAKFSRNKDVNDSSTRDTSLTAPRDAITSKTARINDDEPEELFVPGTVYYLKRNSCSKDGRELEYYTLWKQHPCEHLQRIVLSSNIFSDHKCDSHYYALRDVLKALPGTDEEGIFR
ncbi:uncharacterized protein [Euphorbia lathyris]|uniref:uncharacterized protein isoform X1 n=2 Tax=Euphorbia lathyris TaxID=212925 RepID=UPI003313BDF3